MPRKKRQIRADFLALGFRERQGKGDHTVYSHPSVAKHYSVDGKDGADAKPYDERNLAEAQRLLEEIRRRNP